MNASFDFDILTNMYLCGADSSHTELRIPSIRGELRWWFRVLGGFRRITSTLSDQEYDLFGGLRHSKKRGAARSALTLRVVKSDKLSDASSNDEPCDYFLWPLRKSNRRFWQPNNATKYAAFTLHVSLLPTCACAWDDVMALLTVFGCLGTLGFRGRRGFGAVAFHSKMPMTLQEALKHFSHPAAIDIRMKEDMADTQAMDCVRDAARWLREWRSYGPKGNRNENGPGAHYAKHDHDAGLEEHPAFAYRPALGLPIIQRYSDGSVTRQWMPPNAERFASPIRIRPIRLPSGKFRWLAIFVEARRWPQSQMVKRTTPKGHQSEVTCAVYTDLYDAMRESLLVADIESLF